MSRDASIRAAQTLQWLAAWARGTHHGCSVVTDCVRIGEREFKFAAAPLQRILSFWQSGLPHALKTTIEYLGIFKRQDTMSPIN